VSSLVVEKVATAAIPPSSLAIVSPEDRPCAIRDAPDQRMNPPVPEAKVLIHKVTRNRYYTAYEFHIRKVIGFKHWDKRHGAPKR
jgi:hypothetical protein